MAKIELFRYRPKRLSGQQFHGIAEAMHLDGKFSEADEGMVMHNGEQVMTWSQPGARFGGLLTYGDRSRSLAEPARDMIDDGKAGELAKRLLEKAGLMPKADAPGFDLDLKARTSMAMVEQGDDGAKRQPMHVDVSAEIRLADLPVIGPRAKVRMAFGDGEVPHFLHVGLWESLEPYETAELIDEDRLRKIVDERLRKREKGAGIEIRDISLAYWAQEYAGGADLLAPHYFVEIVHMDGREHGPRQVMPFAAHTTPAP